MPGVAATRKVNKAGKIRAAKPDAKGRSAAATKPPVGDDAVRARTGKVWAEWFAVLDAAGATTMSHREIAEYLSTEHRVPPWWTQMVTVGYERARGMRDAHQTPSGYQVGASKTIAVPLRTLYAAWVDDATRRRWLRDPFTVRRATPAKSLRITWGGGSSVVVYFQAKGVAKSQVAIDHHKLANRAEVERKRAYWREHLDRLKTMLEKAK